MKIKCSRCMFEVKWVAIDKSSLRVYFCAADDNTYYIEFATYDEAYYAMKQIASDEYYAKPDRLQIKHCPYSYPGLDDFM